MAASAKRITLTELKTRAKKGDLTEKELRAYFELDEENSEAFVGQRAVVEEQHAHVDAFGVDIGKETLKRRPIDIRTGEATIVVRRLGDDRRARLAAGVAQGRRRVLRPRPGLRLARRRCGPRPRRPDLSNKV